MIDKLNGMFQFHQDALNLRTFRQQVLASNIANADTPGYKTRDINFQSEFQSLTSGSRPDPVEVSNLPVKNDGNNVDLDREARLLAENALRFSLASNLMRSQIRLVKEAIQEGKSS